MTLCHGDISIGGKMDTVYTQRKNQSFQLRLPERMKEEIRRMAEMDGISINSAIVQRLARCLREERANGQ